MMTVFSLIAMSLLLCLIMLIDISDADCNSPLGMANGDKPVTDAQITALDYYPGNLPKDGRLNNANNWATAARHPTDPWIQVDFLEIVSITGIQTQGSASTVYTEWVTKLQIKYGVVKDALTSIMEGSVPKTFDANSDRHTVVTITFPETINARFLRIIPTEAHDWPSLRFEVTGCPYDILSDKYRHDGGNHCIQNHDIIVFEKTGLVSCGLECNRRQDCLSFNWQTTSPGTTICTLNSAKRENVDAVNYVPLIDCRYYYPL